VDASRAYHTEYGMTFNAVDVLAADWFNEYTLTFAQDINKGTKDDISAVLQQGMLEGWSVPTMQSNLDTLFDQYIQGNLSPADFEWFKERMPAYRTEMIARTETIGASNTSAFRTMKSWGAEYKSWLATMDSRTRYSHQVAYSDYGKGGRVGPIPVDEPFMVNGQRMMYPGDKTGGAGEIVNCRCTLLSWFGDELGDSPQPESDPFRVWKRRHDADDYASEWQPFILRLNNQERQALGELPDYLKATNAFLRDGRGLSEKAEQVYKGVQSAFATPGAAAPENLTVWLDADLGVEGDAVEQLAYLGTLAKDKGYVLASISKRAGGDTAVRVPKGTPGIYLGALVDEPPYAWLFPASTVLRIIDVARGTAILEVWRE